MIKYHYRQRMDSKLKGGSLAAVTKKYSHLLRSNETMTTQILFGPDLDYDEADVASFESSWTDDTTVDSQSVDDTENNDQDSRVATEFPNA